MNTIEDVVRDMVELSFNIDSGSIIGAIQDNYRPEEVFAEEELKKWALENGFVEKEE